MSLVATLKALAAAGGTPEQLIAVVEAHEASRDDIEARRRAADAARTARYRERGGGKIPIALRAAVFERDGYSCLECASTDHLQCDHIHPVSKGGPTTLLNLQTLCRPCNARKRDRIRKADVRASPRKTADNAGQSGNNADVHGAPEGGAGATRTSAQVVTPSLPSLRSEEVVVVGVEREREADDWPAGKASDHVRLIVTEIASPWLDPSKSPDLVTTAGRLVAWRREGASWEHDVVPVIRGLCANRRTRIASWKFFDERIARSIADNRAALEIPEAGAVRATGPPTSLTDRIAAEHAEARRRALAN